MDYISINMTDFKLDLKLLETLTNAFGPSGHEDEVQKITDTYVKQVEEILSIKEKELMEI